MDNFSKKEMQDALETITLMIERCKKAQEKLMPGTSQYTLQKNRIEALYIALVFIKKELTGQNETEKYTKQDFEKAVAPITSLISKSEKSIQKLAHGTWQYTMLEKNLKALYIALPALKQAISLE